MSGLDTSLSCFKTRYETEYFRLREKVTKILLEVACEQALEETRKAFPWSFSFFPLMVTLLLKYWVIPLVSDICPSTTRARTI